MGALTRWTAEVERVTLIDLNPHNLAAVRWYAAICCSCRAAHTRPSRRLRRQSGDMQRCPRPPRRAEALLAITTIRARLGDLPGATAAIDEAEAVALRLDARPLMEQARVARAAAISRPVLATLLFTDIVGATESAVSLGDRAWRDHLERHHGIVRREQARAGGREIDTAGDGFLAAFDSPAAGVRCAISVQRALLDGGIPIRAGLHTGECQSPVASSAGSPCTSPPAPASGPEPARFWCPARSRIWCPDRAWTSSSAGRTSSRASRESGGSSPSPSQL